MDNCLHLVVIISLFLKNQTRPITALAKAVKNLKGKMLMNLSLKLAEIRQAGYEFDRMKKNNETFKSKI